MDSHMCVINLQQVRASASSYKHTHAFSAYHAMVARAFTGSSMVLTDPRHARWPRLGNSQTAPHQGAPLIKQWIALAPSKTVVPR